MEGFESFIGLNPWTALFTLINMVITFLVLKKFLFKPVKGMIDDRQKEIDGLYADANKSRSEAEALRRDYELRLNSAKEEGAELIRNATASAQQRGEEILRDAKSEAAAIKEKAAKDIELEKKKAVNDIKDDISGMALDIAEIVVKKEIDPADQSALIEDFIRKMGETK